MTVEGGTIRLFWHAVEQHYYAVACCDVHGDECHKQRTLKPSERGRRAQGRPMAYLIAWLKAGLKASVINERQHKFGLTISRGKRVKARRTFATHPEAAPFEREERPAWSDEEDEEPWDQP